MVELFRTSRTVRIVTVAAICAAVGVIIIAWLMGGPLTRFVEGDQFRASLEKETAKGLHFAEAHYSPIRRTGTFSAQSDTFQGKDGRKAMRELNAAGITAKFNPWGIFQRRWQLDDVHVATGKVEIQTYTPRPEPSPVKPWIARVLLPERVYLKQLTSDPVDVTWQFREQTAGFFQTRLLITPHDRDFDYRAREGILKMRPLPEFRLRQTHLLITKTLLTLYDLDLETESTDGGTIHAEGHAGIRDDRRVDFTVNFDKLPVVQWEPVSWREHVNGAVSGRVVWQGEDPTLEKSRAEGLLRVADGRVTALPLLQKLAVLSGVKGFERLRLDDCSCMLSWVYPNGRIRDISIEEKGKFRITGNVEIRTRSLGGAIRLGFTREYLAWLPRAQEIFSSETDGYLWTTVHLSGTIDAPEQDLSPRVMALIERSPGAIFKLLFRQSRNG
jgi:hypothetical protein